MISGMWGSFIVVFVRVEKGMMVDGGMDVSMDTSDICSLLFFGLAGVVLKGSRW